MICKSNEFSNFESQTTENSKSFWSFPFNYFETEYDDELIEILTSPHNNTKKQNFNWEHFQLL